MADVFTKAKRSAIMSRVKSAGNLATEVRVAGILRAASINGWRRNYDLFGKPDFVFPKHRLALFVDGCFWHCCPIHRSTPQTNTDFWKDKLRKNKARDQRVNRFLSRDGWTVVRIWQHELKDEDAVAAKIRRRMASPPTRIGGRPAP